MHPFARMATAAVLVLAAVPARGQDRLVLTMEDDNPPFTFLEERTERPTGITTDMVRLVMDRAGVQHDIKPMPWAQAFRQAAVTAGTCVFATNRTAEREERFKWVGPLSTNGWALFAYGSTPPTLRTIDDAAAYTVGSHADSAFEDFLRRQGGLRLVSAIDNTLNLRRLAVGRIDLWATGLRTGPWLARRLGVAPLTLVLTVRDGRHYLACNPAVPDERIAALNAAVAELEADGAFDEIRRGYR